MKRPRTIKATLDLLQRAVIASACRADQIAIDCHAIPVASVVTLIEDLAAGRLRFEGTTLVRDYGHGLPRVTRPASGD